MDEKKRQARQSNNNRRRNNSDWSPRTVGTIASTDEVMTFREGLGGNDGHTIISDGDKTPKEFDDNHNHYGAKREGGGQVDKDCGHYIGPGH